jgi:capsular exopolysaccharide synthesis family protein
VRDQTQLEAGAPQLREYLRIVRRRARSIVAITVLVMAAAGALSFVLPPKYISESKVLVRAIAPVSGQPENTIAPNMNTEQQIATSVAVAQLAAQRLHLVMSQEQLTKVFLKGLKVGTDGQTEILDVKYSARTPSLAQSRAAAFAEAYLDYRRNQVTSDLTNAGASFQQRIDALNTQLAQVDRQLGAAKAEETQATLRARSNSLIGAIAVLEGNLASLAAPTDLAVGDIVQDATLPDHPATSHVRNLILAGLVGLALAIGIAFLRDRLDDRLRGRGEVEAVMRAPVIGVMPFGPRRGTAGLALGAAREHGAVPDAFRALRTGFLFVTSRISAKTIVVTSPLPEDGKTTTVANLGLSLAQTGKKVIMVSADLRRPRLHQLFGVKNDLGLTNVLAGERVPWEGLIALHTRNLLLLPSGPSPANVIDLLDSEPMRKLLAEFRGGVDYVLIDTGPIIGAADAMALAPLVDAVLLVANGQQTTRSAATRTRKQLELVNARVLGTVLYDPAEESDYSYYDYSYAEWEPSGNGSLYHPASPPTSLSQASPAGATPAPHGHAPGRSPASDAPAPTHYAQRDREEPAPRVIELGEATTADPLGGA